MGKTKASKSNMRSIDDHFAISAERKGGTNALEALITKPKSPKTAGLRNSPKASFRRASTIWAPPKQGNGFKDTSKHRPFVLLQFSVGPPQP